MMERIKSQASSGKAIQGGTASSTARKQIIQKVDNNASLKHRRL
jgi:hypothetical protein